MVYHALHFFSDQGLYFVNEAGAAAAMYQKSFVTERYTTELCSSTERKRWQFFLEVIYIYVYISRLNKYFTVAVVTDGGKPISKEELSPALVTSIVCMFREQLKRLPSVGCIVCPESRGNIIRLVKRIQFQILFD